MKKKMSRREFIGAAALGALTFPAMAQIAGTKIAHAAGGPWTDTAKPDAKKFKKIAIEEHWANLMVNELKKQFVARKKFPRVRDPKFDRNNSPRLEDFEKFRLADMDKYGVTMQVVSLNSPGVQGVEDPVEAVAFAQKINDEQASIISKYPTRFAGFAGLPMQNPKAAADELERAVTKLGFKGAMIHGPTDGKYLDEKEFWVVWERAQGLGVPLYLHITDPPVDQLKLYQGHYELLGPTWNWGVECGTQALRIVASGVFDVFPKATLILGHMGESLPYVLGRMDEGWRLVGGQGITGLKKLPSQYIKENIMITTSGLYYPETMLCAIKALGADRIMWAVDYPFVSLDEAVPALENCPISDEDKEKIYHCNAEKLFGL